MSRTHTPAAARTASARRRRAVLAAAGSAGLWLAATGSAAAHITPQPSSVEAGRTTVVSFTIEHGCDTSPTVEVAVAVPPGFGTLTGVAGPGWTVSNEPTVVTFRGGELPATEPGTFELSVTPAGGARTVRLPMVQRCRQGELRWIAVAEPGAPEPAYPAPALTITGSAPAAPATTAAATTAATTATAPTTAAATGATAGGTGGTGTAHDDGDGHGDSHGDGDDGTAEDATGRADGSGGDAGGGSAVPLIVGGAIAAAGVVLGVGWTARRGRRR